MINYSRKLWKKKDPMGALNHSHRDFIKREYILSQEDLQTILGRSAIQMSVDPLKIDLQL